MKDLSPSDTAPTATKCPHTIGVTHLSDLRPSDALTAEATERSDSSEGEGPTPFESLPKEAFLGSVTSGVVWLHGPCWLRQQLGDGPMFGAAALVLAEMLRVSIERKRDEVPLSWAWVRSLVGDSKSRNLISKLKEMGAIVPAGLRGPWYFKIPNRYRFTSNYKRLPIGPVELGPKLVLRYKEHHENLIREAFSSAPVYKVLWEDLRHLSLHASWVNCMPSFSASEWMKEWSWLRSVERIATKECYFSCTRAKPGVSDLPGRLHTTFCSTPGALRKYALIDGAPVTCIDVKASQPYLHSTLIPDCEEKRRYLQLVKSGRFYEELAAAGKMTEAPRTKIKQQVFTYVYYGRNEAAEHSPLWTAFRSLFPRLAEAIWRIKQNGHQLLPIKMQFLEANIILHTAVPALKEREPEARVLTVHDAIYVRTEYVNTALECLRDAFQTHTGDSPEFNVEGPPTYTTAG